ncbi:MAG: MFS transporter, partial [Candidatus Dormibacteria bacterium]
MAEPDPESTVPSPGGPRGWRRLLVEPPRPRSVARNPNAHWLVVATVCVGAFMGQLDASIVVIALHRMQNYFHSNLGAVEWVSLAYLLTLIALVTAVGRFADMAGRKLLYIYGFAIFIIGSGLCGAAPNLIALDLFRVLQGFGAAMLQANSVALIVQAMPPKKLGRGIGVQGAAQALGLALGPAVGGALLTLGGLQWGWRLLFWVNVPAGLIGFGLGWFLLPRSRHLEARHPIDWMGLGLFVVAIAGLLVALTFGDQIGWGSPTIVAGLVAAVVFGLGFILWERRFSDPMMRLSTFANKAFSFGI